MIVWATEFPAPVDASPDAVLAVAEEWLRGSPHFPWGDKLLAPVPHGETVRTVHEGQVVERTRLESEGSRWAGFRHTWTEDVKREWTTDVVACASVAGATIAVRLECNLLAPGLSLPRPKKPYVVKLLLKQFSGSADSWLNVRDKPTLLHEAQVDEAAAIVLGSTAVRLPIVYISAGPGHRPQVDPIELSEWLAGMAHVVVEPSRYFSFALARSVERSNPYGGAVAVFWPRGLERQTRLLPRDYDSADDLASDVVERVRAALAAVRPTPELTWAFLHELSARQRLDALRAAGSTEVAEFLNAFDAEVRAKDERVAQAEREIARLHAELRRSDAAGQAARGLLSPGKEPEYYPAEVKDAVLHALRASLNSLDANGRRRHIVEDLLHANQSSGNEQEIAEEVKRCFNAGGDLTTASRRTLEDLGFHISEDGKHYKAVLQGDGRYTFTISRSSSDHRAGKNLASEITRKLFR